MVTLFGSRDAGPKAAPRGAGRYQVRVPDREGDDADAAQSEPSSSASSPDLSANLRRIFDRRDPTHAGSIHLLGLESLHTRLGDRWPAVSGRVHQLAEKLLAQHMAEYDAWFQHGPEAYVVVFAHLGPDQAQLICAKIVEQLQVMLLGHADTDSIVVHTAMHQLGSEMVMVPSNLKQMLDSAAAAARIEAVETPISDSADLTAQRARNLTLRASTPEPTGPLQVRYRPVWDVGKQVLSLYMARCYRSRPGRTPQWGYDCLEDPHDAQQILDLDLWVAHDALETALELYENRFRFFLSLPLHFETLAASPRRTAVATILKQIPPHLLPFATYHLYGVPEGVPSGRLAEFAAFLKPYGRTVMVETTSLAQDLSPVGGTGVRVVNTPLPLGISADRCRAEVGRFVAAAGRQQLLPSVEGVTSVEIEDICEAAGVRFLSGDLIGGWVDVPEHVVRRSRTDFQRQAPKLLRDRH